jgi:hypothetical protein
VFEPGNLTGWVSPWGAINYAGLGSDGSVVALWWTPTTGWRSDVLGHPDTPRSLLASHQSPDGMMSILGVEQDNDVFRLGWDPHDNGPWSLESLTDSATRV